MSWVVEQFLSFLEQVIEASDNCTA